MTIKPIHAIEQVFNTVENLERELDNWGHESKALLKSKDSLFVHADKIALVSSHQFTGINRKSKKRWFRWETFQSQGLRTTHKGTIVPFAAHKNGHGWKPVARMEPLDPRTNMTMSGYYTEYVKKVFGITSLTDIYPMLGKYGLDRMRDLPRGMHRFFRLDNEKDFTKAVFGKSNYRRDLLKAVCNANPNRIALMREFNGLVPVDWQIQWMNNSEILFPTDYKGSHGLRRILTQIDPRSYRRLLQDNDTLSGNFIHDIVNFSNLREAIGPIYVRTFEEFHNEFWGGIRSQRQHRVNEPIKQLKLAKELHGLTIGKLQLKTAQETDDMVTWGERMSNCISGYAREATGGNGIYGAVEYDGKVVANYEIKNKSLKQLLGRFNQQLPADIKSAVVTTLMDKGVDCNGEWWGK